MASCHCTMAKECICSRGKGECKRVSEAFAQLGDARSSFTQIPQLVTSSEGRGVQSNRLREALLRHILPDHKQRRAFDDSDGPKYIANHHFHPAIVLRCAANGDSNAVTLPTCLTERELILLKIKFSLADMVTNEFATPTGEFYVVPNYSFHRTVRDLRKCAKSSSKLQKSQGQLFMLQENESFSGLQQESFTSLQSKDRDTVLEPQLPSSPRTKSRQLLLLQQSESFSSLRSTDELIFQPNGVVPIPGTTEEEETEGTDTENDQEVCGDDASPSDKDKQEPNDTSNSGQAPPESTDKDDLLEKEDPQKPDTESEQVETDVVDKEKVEACTAVPPSDTENQDPEALSTLSQKTSSVESTDPEQKIEADGEVEKVDQAGGDELLSDIDNKESNESAERGGNPEKDEPSSDTEGQDTDEAVKSRSEQALLKWDEMLREMNLEESKPQLDSTKIADAAFFKEFVQIMEAHDADTGSFTPEKALSESSNLSLDWLDLLNILENQQLDFSGHSEQASTAASTVLEDDVDEDKVKLDCKISFLHTASPFIILSDANNRDESNYRMLEYESRRSAVHQKKLDAIRLRWHSSIAVLQNGLRETYRAERIVAGCAQANQIFASAMDAISEDAFLDDRGETVTSKRKKQQLFEKRRNLDYTVATSINDDYSADDDSCHTENEDEDNDGSMEDAIADGKRGGMLGPLLESQSAAAGQLADDAQLMTDGICQEMTEFRTDFERKVEELERLGNTTIEALEAIEARVVRGWEKMDSVAAKAHSVGETPATAAVSCASQRKRSDSDASNSSPEPDQEKGSSSTPTSPNSVDRFPGSEVLPSNIKREQPEQPLDAWLVKMQYRVLVAYQASAWEKSQLPKLFESVVDLERERETRLQELLLAFLPRQRRLLMGVNHSQVLEELMHPEINEDTIKAGIDSDVVQHSHELLEEDLHRNETDEFAPLPPLAESQDVLYEMDSLTTPLSSKLVLSSAILEKKRGWRRWKPELIVVTADLFLHMFDMPYSDGALSPEDAFRELVPVLDGYRDEASTGGPKDSTRRLLKNMTSFFLPNCTIMIHSEKKQQFEVVQHSVGMFGQSKTQKLVLRTKSAAETSKWIGTLLKKESHGSEAPEKFDDVELEEKVDEFIDERTASGSPKVPGEDVFHFDRRLSLQSRRRDERDGLGASSHHLGRLFDPTLSFRSLESGRNGDDLGASSHHFGSLFDPTLSFRSLQPGEGETEDDDKGSVSNHVLGLTA